ncbi:flagellar biosynthesis repressor FlbT [Methylocystis sp. MJC1]|jgi:flagellar protein FlbT|uniref:flagellar biosynthesis repressor FlbT n=1 Tax=Methylocystis sp. MJC1 TaxID=2654282 RepID=UPI0013EA5455|nr:flagellar biosynthesis repressor FlbT [Methylocystis sp. MJC1]KAF2990631.1 flagellum biosynthesis repressor protein FlbT [Methylocystis sp. MJC1]MBU6525708.1 flagellar biosynthesis repressor FlbT [Methylocystis sp. MJC1]UZX12179.1 flagellar biosynthesis repressor FlbT [Methylocystis sp. MJC1]
MNISLKRGEKIYINGAVFRVDRKVCIELLNDVTFLLENHVMQAADATTPLKQLYFAVQLMLISPNDIDAALYLSRDILATCSKTIPDPRIVEGLSSVAKLIEGKRYFDALKILRGLFPLEAEIPTDSKTGCAA